MSDRSLNESVETSAPWPPSRREAAVLIGILVVAAALRIAFIGAESLSMDEGFSLDDAAHWPGQGISALRPVYYGALALWMQLGTSDAWLRGLGVIFGLGCVLLTWVLGRRTLGVRTALVGAVLVAISTREVAHSQEIRMYTMAAFFALLASLAVLRVAQRPTAAGIAAWAGLRILAGLTATFTLLLLCADAVLLLRRGATRRLGLALGSALVGVGMLLVVFPQPLRAAIPWWRALSPPGLEDVPRVLVLLTTGLRTSDVGSPAFMHSPAGILAFIVLAAVVAMLVGVGAVEAWDGAGRWVVAWAAAVPLGLAWLSYTSMPMWMYRYPYFASPYLLLVVANGLVTLGRRRPRLAIAIVLVYAAGAGAGLIHQYADTPRADFRAMAAEITTHRRPGEPIAVTDPGAAPALLHYLPAGTEVVRLRVPILPEPEEEAVIRALRPLAEDSRPVWLVHWHFLRRGPREATIRRAIEATFDVRSATSFRGGDVLLVAARSRD